MKYEVITTFTAQAVLIVEATNEDTAKEHAHQNAMVHSTPDGAISVCSLDPAKVSISNVAPSDADVSPFAVTPLKETA